MVSVYVWVCVSWPLHVLGVNSIFPFVILTSVQFSLTRCLCACPKSAPESTATADDFYKSQQWTHIDGGGFGGVQLLRNYLSELSTFCHTLKTEDTQQPFSLLRPLCSSGILLSRSWFVLPPSVVIFSLAPNAAQKPLCAGFWIWLQQQQNSLFWSSTHPQTRTCMNTHTHTQYILYLTCF